MAKHPQSYRQYRKQAPAPLRASWRTPRPEMNQRGTFADLADKVREHRERITTKATDKTEEANNDQQPTD